MLRQFDTLYAEVGNMTSEKLNAIILGFVTYFFPVNVMSKKVRDAPRNEEAVRFKINTIRCLSDLS